jgi:hypothetical protein
VSRVATTSLLGGAVLSVLASPPASPASSNRTAAAVAPTGETSPPRKPLRIRVNAGRTVNAMASGVGASWHALSRDIPLDNERYAHPAREESPRGSAWGGNPPAARERAWQQIEAHARWLGLDLFRVEFDQRMYQPERDRFDWDNEEMRALYRILDACERLGADVFLQQMWRHVEWNAWPGVHPLISAPRSLEDHARGLATLVEHLVARKGYRSIRWLSIANEPPGGTWGYWWSYGDAPAPGGLTPITPALVELRRELDARGIEISLSAPDWTDLPPFPAGGIDFDASVGAYDIHAYQGLDAGGAKVVAQWAAWAHGRSKPLLLTEFGNMALGWGKDNPGPATYPAVLSNAEVVIRALNAGADGLNRWSFTNRGDLDGQWQLVRTWDRERRAYRDEVSPEPVPFFGYGLLTRFVAKGSRVVECHVDAAEDAGLLATAVMSPGGRLTVLVLNKSGEERSLSLEAQAAPPGDLHLYRVEEALLGPSFRMEPLATVSPARPAAFRAPPRSVTVLTGFGLRHDDDGVTIER